MLETDQTRLLIDAGLSGRQIRLRLAKMGRSPETLDGILLTHEHTDHTQGLKALCGKLEIPVYCNRLTADELRGSTAPVSGASCAGLGATTAPPWSSQSRSVRKQSRACAGH